MPRPEGESGVEPGIRAAHEMPLRMLSVQAAPGNHPQGEDVVADETPPGTLIRSRRIQPARQADVVTGPPRAGRSPPVTATDRPVPPADPPLALPRCSPVFLSFPS